MTSQATKSSSYPTQSPLKLPPRWAQSRLSRHVRINAGLVDPEIEPYSSMPLIAPNHIQSGTGRILYTESSDEQGAESGKYLVRRGQVIYSKIRPNLMKVALAPTDCLCSADMYGLEGHAGQIDNGYLKWFLLSREFTDQIVLESLRSALPKVNRDSLGASKIWFPAIAEQIHLSRFLDREIEQIDDLVAKQERLIELLGERRASLMNRIVCGAGTGWPHRPLKRRARITVGIVVTPSVWYSDEGVLALRGVNIRPEAITLNDVVRLTKEGHALHSKSELRTGDVVVVRTGQAGAAAVIPENLNGSNAIDLLIIRPDPGIDGEYLAMIVNTSTVQEQVRQHSVGAIQAHFNVGSLREVAVSIPPLEIQRKAVKTWREKSADLDALSAKSTQLVARLRERRSALISAAVTGKIDVQGLGVTA